MIPMFNRKPGKQEKEIWIHNSVRGSSVRETGGSPIEDLDPAEKSEGVEGDDVGDVSLHRAQIDPCFEGLSATKHLPAS